MHVVKESLIAGQAYDSFHPKICQHKNHNDPFKMTRWKLDPLISAGGNSKGKMVSRMSTGWERNEESDKNTRFYLHFSLKAASYFNVFEGSTWYFECTQ